MRKQVEKIEAVRRAVTRRSNRSAQGRGDQARDRSATSRARGDRARDQEGLGGVAMSRTYGTGHIGLRGRIFWMTYYVRGKRIQKSCETSNENVAKRKLIKAMGETQSGKPVGPRIEKTTFKDLAEILINDLKANGRKIKKTHAPLEHARAYFTNHELAINITNDRLVAFVAHQQDAEFASATINRSLAALRRAFRLALRAGRVATLPHFPMLREKNARKGFFEHDQFDAVLKHLPDYLQPVMQVAYITGWRVPSDILTREWRSTSISMPVGCVSNRAKPKTARAGTPPQPRSCATS